MKWPGLVVCLCVSAATCLARDKPWKVERIIKLDGEHCGRYTQTKYMSSSSPPGLPTVLYNHETENGVHVHTCYNQNCSQRSSTSIDAQPGHSGDNGRFISMLPTPQGLPFFSYISPNKNLRTAYCNTAGCTDSDNVVVTSIHDCAIECVYPSVGFSNASEGANFPLIAFVDQGHAVALAYCRGFDCSTGARVRRLTSKKGNYGYPKLDLLPSGYPVVVFYDEDAQNLTMAICEDALCTQVVTVVLDGSGDVGKYLSMKVGTDGHPITMYTELSTGNLKVVHCSDPLSSHAAQTITVVDKIGTDPYGEFPEISIDPKTGFAVLSYIDQTNADKSILKVARCANVACSSSTVQEIQSGLPGYGRDSSLAIDQSDNVYLSFLDYNGGDRKIARLAVLSRQ